MAKILVSCAAADGHVNPFVSVVTHLIKKGHEIVWLCGRAYQTKIEATGATFLGLPEAFDPKGMDLYEFKPELKRLKGIAQIKFYVKTWCYDMAEPTLQILEDLFIHFEPDLYISDPMVYGPYLRAELLKKPCINLHVIPLTIFSKDHGPFGTALPPTDNLLGQLKIDLMNFVVGKLVFNDIKRYCNTLRIGLGLPRHQNVFDDFIKNATTVFATTVPGLDYQRSDLPKNVKYLGPILPGAKLDFIEPEWWCQLRDNRKVILVNQGTIATDISELIVPTIQALKDENVLLIAVPVKESIEDLPSNVKVAEFIPFGNLLPYVDVMVTNGGFGATNMALAYGVPMVCSGGSEDKMEVSAMVAYAGCGINLKKLSPSPKSIRNAVREVLGNPDYRTNAEQLQKEITSYVPLDLIAEEIERLT